MQAENSMEGVLGRIVAAAVSEVGPVEHAGITEVDHRRVYTRAASGDLVHRIDAVQYRTNQGPCLDSLREQVTVRCDDLTEETRWPKYAKAAVDEGLRSLLSVQLFVHGANLGALNLYARDVHAFSDDDESTAMLLASHAAVAMKGNEVEVNLRTALASRDRIGQAKGILMERYKISDTEAFDLLVLASQRTHRKLRDVADELAATGELRIG